MKWHVHSNGNELNPFHSCWNEPTIPDRIKWHVHSYATSWVKQLSGQRIQLQFTDALLIWTKKLLPTLFYINYWQGHHIYKYKLKLVGLVWGGGAGGLIHIWSHWDRIIFQTENQHTRLLYMGGLGSNLVPANFWVSGRYNTCLSTHHKEVKWMNERTRNMFTWNKTFNYHWTWDYGTLTFESKSLNPQIKRYY